MPQVLDWQSPTAQPAAMIDTCVQAIKAGQVIAYPTESAYFLVCDPKNKTALTKLKQLLGEDADYPILEAHPPMDQPVSVIAGASPLARRFGRRVWPGPVAITTTVDKKSPAIARYFPNSRCSHQFMQSYGMPLTFGGITDEEGMAIIDSAKLIQMVGDKVAVVMDVGETHFGDLPTVLAVDGNRFKIPFEGVVPKDALVTQSAWLVIFVCTGNTCRSPLAEVLMKKTLAEKLGCDIEELSKKGYRVTSMGLSALPGNTATSEALIVAREMKTDLSAHRSRPVMPELFDMADYVIGMTRIHKDSLVALYPKVEPVVRLICGTTDLSDPIGGDLAVYRTCAKTMEKHITKLATDMLTIGEPVYQP